MDYGFTEDIGKFVEVVRFRQDALNDGWTVHPYIEPHIDRWAKLRKEGFTMYITTRAVRATSRKIIYRVAVAILNRHGVQIPAPRQYCWLDIAVWGGSQNALAIGVPEAPEIIA